MNESRIRDIVTNVIKENEDDIKDLRNKLSNLEIQNSSLKVFRSFLLWISGTLLVPFIVWVSINITSLNGSRDDIYETFTDLPTPAKTEHLDKKLGTIDNENDYIKTGLLILAEALKEGSYIDENEYKYFLDLKK